MRGSGCGILTSLSNARVTAKTNPAKNLVQINHSKESLYYHQGDVRGLMLETTVTKRSFSESDSTKMYSSSILSLKTTNNKTVMV